MIDTIKTALEHGDEAHLLDLLSARAKTIQSALASHDLQRLEMLLLEVKQETAALESMRQALSQSIDTIGV